MLTGAIKVEAGDHVLITFAQVENAEYMAALRQSLMESFPGTEFTLLGPCNGALVVKPKC